jgi:uncharacterized protein (DUF983 family)
MSEPVPKLKTVVARGWRRRCPRCGEGPIYQRWITLHESCSHCGLRYLQDQGDLWAYLVAFDRALFILPLIVMIYFRVYVPDSNWYLIIGLLLFVGFVFTLPHRNGVGLGVDYLIRCKWGDLSKDAETQTPDDSQQK